MDDLYQQVKAIVWKVMHFRWLALSFFVVACLIGWSVVWLLPNQYEVKAQVYVDTQSVLRPLLKGLAVDNTVKEQAALLMRRTLLARPNIEKVILETDLDLTVTTDKEMERLVLSLANGIEVKGHADRRRPDANVYTVRYVNTNATTAFKVVEELLSVFLESTLGMTRQDSTGAAQFLNRQIEEYRVRLEESDDAIKRFNTKYSDMLPNEKMGFYQRLSQAELILQEAELDQKEARFRVEQLNTQISKIDQKISAAVMENKGQGVADKISALELQLGDLQLRYTDDHPDVISTLSALEKLKNSANEVAPEPSGSKVLVDNPVYQELSVLQSQAEAELAGLGVRVEEYRRRVADLRSRLETFPQIEAEYTALVRDYDVTLKTYQELVQRRESAMISEQADKSGDTVQFRVIEPPVMPLTPIGPNRPMFLSAVLAIAIGIAIGLAMVFAQLRGAIYSKTELQDEFSLPVLGEVSMVWSANQVRRKRFDIVALVVSGLGMLLLFALLLYYQVAIVGMPLG